MSPRVRFAPSPTGYLHVGNARTALFNWLFARHEGGIFVLRIEDTDVERNREEAVDVLLSSMAWLGLDIDEGPYRQSERGPLYEQAIDRLWSSGALYACDCTREEVDARTKGNAIPGYDGHCRGRGLERAPGRALRFRTPDSGVTIVHDLVRGDVTFPHDAMEDFVLVKGTGQPLFILANVVDDRDMAITHVIRGEDLLPTTPKGLLVWAALDRCQSPVVLPAFAHVPMIVNESRKKLSKRRDPVMVEAYRNEGYLPEAFRNYLALLGWSPPGTEEKVPLDVLAGEFRLGDVHKAPAFFDVAKLRHMNGDYVRELSLSGFISRTRPWLAPEPDAWAPPTPPPWPPERFDPERFELLAGVVQERVTTLDEVPPMVDFVFLADPPVDEASWQRAIVKDAEADEILRGAIADYEAVTWEREELHATTRALGERFGRSLGKVQAPIRVAVTGRTVGPPLFESLEVVGREEVLRRLHAALDRIQAGGAATAAASAG
jgi:glutamyl-tRNA synthetase